MDRVATALAAIEQAAVLCWLATVDAHGRPNVSPKEVFSVIGPDRLAIAHIASPTSVANIAANPSVCVGFVDVFVQKGWKLVGSAEVVRRGAPGFDAWAAPLQLKAGSALPVRAAIVVDVRAASPIVAPSYRLDGDGVEQERRKVREARLRYLRLLQRHRSAMPPSGRAT